VDIVLTAASGGHGTVIDVGTGSGAIALSLATEGGFSRVLGSDISADALDVAELNACIVLARRGGPGGPAGAATFPAFAVGSFLAPWRGERASVVVSNPPYIATSEAADLPGTVRDWEPAVALFAEDDGMAAIAAIAREAAPVLVPGGLLALEVDARRAGSAAGIVSAVGSYGAVSVRPDLSGRARFVVARRVEN
jgi:release factor glutamine methyltransferase